MERLSAKMPRRIVVRLPEGRYGVKFEYHRSVLVNVLLLAGAQLMVVSSELCVEDTKILVLALSCSPGGTSPRRKVTTRRIGRSEDMRVSTIRRCEHSSACPQKDLKSKTQLHRLRSPGRLSPEVKQIRDEEASKERVRLWSNFKGSKRRKENIRTVETSSTDCARNRDKVIEDFSRWYSNRRMAASDDK
jgi:hypothetical protein